MIRLAALYLSLNTLVYAAHGIAAFPAQEWLLELLVSIVFLFPVLSATRFGFTPGIARAVGIALLAHVAWDLLHWPGHALVLTPIHPLVPRLDPVMDVLLGAGVLLGSKGNRASRRA